MPIYEEEETFLHPDLKITKSNYISRNPTFSKMLALGLGMHWAGFWRQVVLCHSPSIAPMRTSADTCGTSRKQTSDQIGCSQWKWKVGGRTLCLWQPKLWAKLLRGIFMCRLIKGVKRDKENNFSALFQSGEGGKDHVPMWNGLQA